MIDAAQIKPLMEILGADDVYVGLVDTVTDDGIAMQEGRTIPLDWVDYTWDHKLKLSLTRDEAQARLRGAS